MTVTESELAEVRIAKPDVRLQIVPTATHGFVQWLAAPCPFLAGADCSVYAVRPLNCRRMMCGRDSVDEPVDLSPIPLKVLRSPALRRQYSDTQAEAHRTWGLAHGWRDDGLGHTDLT